MRRRVPRCVDCQCGSGIIRSDAVLLYHRRFPAFGGEVSWRYKTSQDCAGSGRGRTKGAMSCVLHVTLFSTVHLCLPARMRAFAGCPLICFMCYDFLAGSQFVQG